MTREKIIGLSLFATMLIQGNLLGEDIKTKQSLGSVDIVSSDVNEGFNSYTVDSMNTSTKLDLSIRHTPQSVSVFTTSELKDMGITSYQNLLTHITGVSLDRWDERIKASARGFTIDYYKLDGMPTYSTHNDRDIDLTLYERVEVVRGANGFTTGAGNPGISINLVRKKANSKELKGDITLKAGSWNTYGVEADIASKLNESGNVRGRLMFNHEDNESYMDEYERKNTSISGIVEADLSDSTTVSLGASYQKLDKSGIRWGGLPAFDSNGNRVDFDISKIATEDWTYWNNEVKSVFANLEQSFANDISLNVAYSHNETQKETALFYVKGAIHTSDGSGISSLDFQAEEEHVEDNLDLNVNIPFEVSGLSQEIVIGGSYNRDKTKMYEGRYPNGYAYDSIPNFYDFSIPLPSVSSSDIPYSVKPEETVQKAIYLANKFSLTEDLKLIAGARLSSWEYTSTDSSKDTRKFDNQLTPYLGLVYDFDENHSIYTSYTSIFNPQDEQNIYGEYLDPIEGNSYEVGIKGEYFEGLLNTSLSLFRINQDNVAQKDEDNKVLTDPTKDAYKAAKGVTSKGFEIDIAGQVTDNLSMHFGIANFKAEEANGDKYNTLASRTTANLFTSYKINDFTLGGGLQYKSKFYTVSDATLITQKAYTLVNTSLGYKINKNTNLQLNVNNLFDKTYYEGIGTNSMTYGSPREFKASLKYSF